MNKTCLIVAAAALTAVSISTTQAQPYALAGDFNGWNNANTIMETNTPGALYSYTMGGTANGGCYYKVIAVPGSWGTTYPNNNFWTYYGANGSNTVYFYPGTTADGWQPLNNRVGQTNDNLGLNQYEIVGDFNGWSGSPSSQMIYAGNGIFTNLYTIPSAGTHSFKFRTPGTWDSAQIGSDFGQNTGNGSFDTTNANQVVLFQIDLPKGRWLVGNPAPPPVTNDVVFAVDMTSQTVLGNFTPGVDAVYVSGAFNGWPGTGGSALFLTNFPALAGNTNVYYATNRFVGTPGSSATFYKFTCNATAFSGSSGYEPRGDNRTFNLLSTNATGSTPYILPVVSFGDVYATDYLTNDVQVVFTVNMTNAKAGVPPITNNWDPSYPVYLNGDFRDAGWGNPWTPPNLLLMTETSPGSQIFTYTYTVKAGKKNQFSYKYGFDDGVNGYDNEAPSFQDHSRVIRLPSSGTYVLPMDTFGNQYVEPSFGDLSVTKIAGNNVQVKFVGRPGVKLQQASSLGGAWTNNNGTDGNGYSGVTEATPNGTATVTNLPASSAAGFFRLIKQN